MSDFDFALLSYMECALWSSTDESGEPLDRFARSNIAEDSAARMADDVRAFFAAYPQHLAGLDVGQVGHDLWLTRNGHGTGFWDRGLGAVGDYLTTAAQLLGEQSLYLGDDGLIHIL